MNHKTAWKPSILWNSLFLFLAFWLPAPVPVLAGGITIDDTVKKGEVLNQSLVLAGPRVAMDGVINGDLVAVGDNIQINGEVDGSLVIAGKQVTLNGAVNGTTYVAAVNLVLGPEAVIGRDVYFVGGSLETQAGSTVNRDLRVVSLETNLAGTVNGEVHAQVGPVKLIRGIMDLFGIQSWLPQPQMRGYRSYQEEVLSQAAAPVMTAGLRLPAQTNTDPTEAVRNWVVPFLRNLAALLITGVLGILLFPAQMITASARGRKSPWRTLLNGLLVLIIGWIVVLLAFVTILGIAFFLYAIFLPNLAFLLGAVGLFALGLAASIFWLSIVYFSKLIVALLIGTLLFMRFKPAYAQRRVLPLLLGIVIYSLLASIPYLGWAVALLSTLFGLGALWMVATERELEGTPSPQETGANLDPNLPAPEG